MENSGSPVGNGTPQRDQATEIRAYLDSLTASPGFASSARRAKLLRHLVERTLAGEGQKLNEYGIGLDVFGKQDSFDPRLESVVRNEVSRLRQKLKEYYSAEGLADRIVIELPLRSYVANITFREPVPISVEPPSIEAPPIEDDIVPVPPRRKWRTAVVGLTIAAALAGAFAISRIRIQAKDSIRSMAVLPFQNLSSDHQDEYLADGLTEELTNELAQWKDLRVVARTSAYEFKGKGMDIREIGRKLKVDAALEGSLAKQGDRIRITAQLIRASDGYHLWSKGYDTRSGDMMTVQQEIARSIAATIRKLGQNLPEPAVHPGTASPEAHDLYLRGSYLLSFKNVDSMKKGLALLEQAVRIDPTYAMAYVQIADVEFAFLYGGVVSQKEGEERLKTALEKAIQADPKCAEAHGMMAAVIHSQDWDWPRAETEFKLAIEQGAGPTTRSLYGWSLTTQGRFSDAMTQLEIAQDLNPLATGQRMNQALLLYSQRRYRDAKNILNELAREHTEMGSPHALLAQIAMMEKDCAGLQAQIDWWRRVYPKLDTTLDQALVTACRGNDEPARQILSKAAVSGQAQRSYNMGLSSAYVHESDLALSFLEKAAAAKESAILNIKNEPMLDGIRRDPRFIALEKRVGLQP